MSSCSCLSAVAAGVGGAVLILIVVVVVIVVCCCCKAKSKGPQAEGAAGGVAAHLGSRLKNAAPAVPAAKLSEVNVDVAGLPAGRFPTAPAVEAADGDPRSSGRSSISSSRRVSTQI